MLDLSLDVGVVALQVIVGPRSVMVVPHGRLESAEPSTLEVLKDGADVNVDWWIGIELLPTCLYML